MPFSQIFPPFPSPRVQKSALYICVSFAVLHIGSSAVTNSSCYYYLENETVLKEDQGTVRRMGSLSVFQTTGCNPLVHCCENNSVVHQQKREEEQSNWVAHSVGDHDKTWNLQTHAHTLKHTAHGQDLRGNPGALRVLARPSSPHTFTHHRQPRPESPLWGSFPPHSPALWPAARRPPLTRTGLLHSLLGWWLLLFRLPAITGPGGGTRVPSAPHCHSRTILLPSPATLPSSGFQTRPRFTPPPTTPRLSPGRALFAGLRTLSFFSKTTPASILGDFNSLTANLPGWRPLSSALLSSKALLFRQPRQLLRPRAPASSV